MKEDKVSAEYFVQEKAGRNNKIYLSRLIIRKRINDALSARWLSQERDGVYPQHP
jgi:hypothetical protein